MVLSSADMVRVTHFIIFGQEYFSRDQPSLSADANTTCSITTEIVDFLLRHFPLCILCILSDFYDGNIWCLFKIEPKFSKTVFCFYFRGMVVIVLPLNAEWRNQQNLAHFHTRVYFHFGLARNKWSLNGDLNTCMYVYVQHDTCLLKTFWKLVNVYSA
jgi:hypothetical protein